MTRITMAVIRPSVLSVVVLCCLSGQLIAQDYIDLVRISYGSSGSTSFEGTSGRTRIVDFGVDTNIPVPVTNRITLLTGFMYELVQTKLYHDLSSQTFQSTGLKLGINLAGRQRQWAGTCVLLPRLSSEFDGINRRGLQLGGLLVFRKMLNKYTNYKIGIYMNDELFGTWIVPMLGLYHHRPDKPWEVSVFLPVSFDVNYALNRRVRAGVMFTGLRRSYQLSTIPTYGGGGYVDRTANDLGIYLSLHLFKGMIIQSRISHSIGRQCRVFGEEDKIKVGFPVASLGDKRAQLNEDVADGWQGQLMIIYRLTFSRPD